MMPEEQRQRTMPGNTRRSRTEGASSENPVGLVKELEGVVHEGEDLIGVGLRTIVEVLIRELGEQDRQAKLVVVVREVSLELVEGGVIPVDALIVNLYTTARVSTRVHQIEIDLRGIQCKPP